MNAYNIKETKFSDGIMTIKPLLFFFWIDNLLHGARSQSVVEVST